MHQQEVPGLYPGHLLRHARCHRKRRTRPALPDSGLNLAPEDCLSLPSSTRAVPKPNAIKAMR